MSDSNEPTFQPEPAAPKRKVGRPRKQPDLNVVVKELQDQIAIMQRAALANQAAAAERFDQIQQQATLAPIPEATPELPPGSYIQLGVDGSGAPIMGKVRWTRKLINETYEPVTFTPMRSMDLGPHGVMYRVTMGEECTVPKIVKDFYDQVIKQEAEERARYAPLTAAERADVDARAANAPGQHWSRVAVVGRGLAVHTPEAPTPETPEK